MRGLRSEGKFPASPCPPGGLSRGKGQGMHNGIWERLCEAQARGGQEGFPERAALHAAPKHEWDWDTMRRQTGSAAGQGTLLGKVLGVRPESSVVETAPGVQ